MLLTTADNNNNQYGERLTTKDWKSIGCCPFVDGVFGSAVSQDQRVFFGRLWKIACHHLSGN
jgi:hypothetical protein